MLKLKRVPEQKEISIVLHKRESRYTRDFWLALIVAISIHLGGLAFFRIKTLEHEPPHCLPPIDVAVDLTETPTLGKQRLFSWNLPPVTAPPLPSLPFSYDQTFLPEEKNIPIPLTNFRDLEMLPYELPFKEESW